MIRVGVIGVGNKGQDHVRDYTMERGAEVIAVADTDEARARRVAGEFKIRYTYKDYRALLDREDIQAVTIATPPHLHYEMVLAAAKKGKHIHCEKPLALTLGQADEMIEVCNVRGLIFFVSFSPRLTRPIRELHKMIASNEYGAPLWLWTRSFLPVDPQTWMPPPWFWHKETSGGLLIENGGHTFDFVHWIMGDVVKVVAMADTLRHKKSWPPYFADPNIEDVGTVVLKHGNGAISTIGICAIVLGWPLHRTVEIITEDGYFQLFGDKLIVERNGRKTLEINYEKSKAGEMTPTGYFVQGIREGISPRATGKEGRIALEIALAALESAKRETVVSLPL